MNNQTRKFFIYTRKSTDTEDRQVRSISDQLAELKELALKEQIEVVDIFVEKQTAKAPGRPVFNEMLLRIEANEASGILAWHPDRLARNSVDGGKIIYLLDTGKIAELKFPTFWCDTTPQGKFKPIITKKLFDSVQEVMMRKSKPHSKGLKPFLYRGFFRCGECGCFITTEQQKGHHYLRCTKRKNPCTQKYVREEIITSQIKKEIKKVSLPLDWTNWMIEENRKDQSSEIQSSEIFSQKLVISL